MNGKSSFGVKLLVTEFVSHRWAVMIDQLSHKKSKRVRNHTPTEEALAKSDRSEQKVKQKYEK